MRTFLALATSLLASFALCNALQHVGRWTSPIGGVPSSKLPSGPILGNGDLGVTVSGNGSELTFWLAMNQFWAIEVYKYPRSPEPPLPRPVPLAQVVVSVQGEMASKLTEFWAEQDVDTAEVRTHASTADNTSWVSTRSFVAINNNTLITELVWYSAKGASQSFNVTTRTYTGIDGAPTSAGCTATLGRGSENCSSLNTAPWGQWVKRQAFSSDGPYAVVGAAATRLLGGGAMNTSSDNTLWSSATFQLQPNNNKTTLVTTALTNRDDVVFFQDPLPAVQAYLGKLTDDGLDALDTEHSTWWTQYWESPRLSLPGDELTEMYWYGSQYALACASREGKVPPGLWGPWVTSDSSAWHGDYTLNYNYQATWYGAYSSNRIEQTINQYQPLMDFRPLGRQGAQAFNCTGLHFPVHIAPWGFASSLGPSPWGDLRQHSTASFSALNFISHWEYTQDKVFVQQLAFPFVSEVAEFWECWLKKETLQNGTYRWVDPSDCTNENCGGDPSDFNPIVSITFIKRIFRGLLDMAKAMGIEAKPIWSDIAENISLPCTVSADIPPSGAKGPVWLFSEVNGSGSVPLPHPGSNPINLYPLWPSEQVTLGSSTAQLETARNTLLFMKSWSEGNAFMEAFPAAVRAGLDTATLMDAWHGCLKSQMGTNMVVFEGGGGTETIGGLQAVNDMLMQSCDPFIRLFPVWPQDQDAAFSELRAKGAFLVSANFSASSKTVLSPVIVRSEAGVTCSVLNPWSQSKSESVVVTDHDGKTTVTVQWKENVMTFPTNPGHVYSIALKNLYSANR